MDSHLSSPYVTIWLKPPIRGRRAVLTLKLGVAPDGVYIDQICHHTCGKLLPYLFTLTFYKAVIFCCTFLKVSLTGRYPASLLYGARTFLVRYLSILLYATVQFTYTRNIIILYLKLKINSPYSNPCIFPLKNNRHFYYSNPCISCIKFL